VSEFHAQVPQAAASEGLAQGSNVAARAGFEITTIRMKGVDPPMSHHTPQLLLLFSFNLFVPKINIKDISQGQRRIGSSDY